MPDGDVQLLVYRLNSFQEIIAVDSAIVNCPVCRIDGITGAFILQAGTIGIIGAFLLRKPLCAADDVCPAYS